MRDSGFQGGGVFLKRAIVALVAERVDEDELEQMMRG